MPPPPPPLNNHSVEGRPKAPATPQAASHKRRLLLSTLASGTAVSPVIGSWSKPIVQSFLLPSHAQSSAPGGTPSTSSTTPTPSPPGGGRSPSPSPSPSPLPTIADPHLLPLCTDNSIVCFRDKRFKDPLVALSALNINGNLEIEVTEAEAFTGQMIVNGLAIADLSGIEVFIALTSLICYNNQLNQLGALDVSKNIALTQLWCFTNQLTALDVSENTALTDLDCRNNELSALDVSENTVLTKLNCSLNELSTLDVSNNTALTSLACDNNQLTALDVSKNTALTALDCDNNQLTALDVSENTALTALDCRRNQLSVLDISKITALATLTLDCTGNSASLSITVTEALRGNIPAGWNTDAGVVYVYV